VQSLASGADCGEGARFDGSAQSDEVWLARVSEGLERLTQVVEEAIRHGRFWSDRVRAGLVALLGFLDDEPEWRQLLLFQVPRDPGTAFVCEQRVLSVLTALLDDGAPQAIGEIAPQPELTGELVAGGVFAVIRGHLLDEEGRPLVELAPSLMAFIVLPYLGHGAAQVELAGISPAAGAARTGTSYKRASTQGPLGPATTASASSPVACRSRWDAHSQTSGDGGSPGGGLARRSIGNREDKKE
jgi:hypothetical protein